MLNDRTSPYSYGAPGIVIPAQALAEAVSTPGPQMDKILQIVNSGNCSVAIAMVRLEKPPNGFYLHKKITEIYYIVSGRGTHFCGGMLINPQEVNHAPTGPGAFAPIVEGGAETIVRQGDVVVVPVGTPHSWVEIASPLTYTVVRLDPERVLASPNV